MRYRIPLLEYISWVSVCNHEGRACGTRAKAAHNFQRLRVENGHVLIGYTDDELAHPVLGHKRQIRHAREHAMFDNVVKHRNEGKRLSENWWFDKGKEGKTKKKSASDEKYVSMLENADLLTYYDPEGDADYVTASCPAHGGLGHSPTSLGIHKESGKWVCQAGCSNSEVYRAFMEIYKESGRGKEVKEVVSDERLSTGE